LLLPLFDMARLASAMDFHPADSLSQTAGQNTLEPTGQADTR
jgi:hypothetical protein